MCYETVKGNALILRVMRARHLGGGSQDGATCRAFHPLVFREKSCKEQTMNAYIFRFCNAVLHARADRALWLPDACALCVADLHMGKSERIARRSGQLLPPFETEATLDRLADAIAATGARTVICLGDSFDDLAAADALPDGARQRLATLQAGRRWIWVTGNHDPGPVDLGGTHLAEVALAGLTFRHEAVPGAVAEVSGHFHPKLALPGAGAARACFLFDANRLILPAFGTYTGGLSVRNPALSRLFRAPAFAVLTGRTAILAPMPSGS